MTLTELAELATCGASYKTGASFKFAPVFGSEKQIITRLLIGFHRKYAFGKTV